MDPPRPAIPPGRMGAMACLIPRNTPETLTFMVRLKSSRETVGKEGCGLDAGVVHHHVEPAEAIDASLHRSFPVGLGGDVQAHEVGLVGAKLRRQGLARSVKGCRQ